MSQLSRNLLLLLTGYGLTIGIVLRLVTQSGSSLLFTLAVGFGTGLVSVASLIVVVVALIFRRGEPSRPGEWEGCFIMLMAVLIYSISFGGIAGLFGLSLAIFILGLDIVIGQPFASQLGWILSGALYGAIWGLGVAAWFKRPI